MHAHSNRLLGNHFVSVAELKHSCGVLIAADRSGCQPFPRTSNAGKWVARTAKRLLHLIRGRSMDGQLSIATLDYVVSCEQLGGVLSMSNRICLMRPAGVTTTETIAISPSAAFPSFGAVSSKSQQSMLSGVRAV
jgi:hypothetical protein